MLIANILPDTEKRKITVPMRIHARSKAHQEENRYTDLYLCDHGTSAGTEGNADAPIVWTAFQSRKYLTSCTE